MGGCCSKGKKDSEENRDARTGLLNNKEKKKEDGKHPAAAAAALGPVQLVSRLDTAGKYVVSVTKVASPPTSAIYVLCRNPSSIVVLGTEPPFEKTTEVSLDELEGPWDMASSTKSRCLYVSDCLSSRIVKVAIEGLEVSAWLTDIGYPNSVTVTEATDRVLVVCNGQPASSLQLYQPDAVLAQRIQLPSEIVYPKHAVQTKNGTFVVSCKVKDEELWGVCEVTGNGEILRKCFQLDESDRMMEIYHLAIDFDGGRLFLADCWKERVVLLEADFSRSQAILTRKGHGIKWPWRLDYDGTAAQLLVLHGGEEEEKIGEIGGDGGKEDGKGGKEDGTGKESGKENEKESGKEDGKEGGKDGGKEDGKEDGKTDGKEAGKVDGKEDLKTDGKEGEKEDGKVEEKVASAAEANEEKEKEENREGDGLDGKTRENEINSGKRFNVIDIYTI